MNFKLWHRISATIVFLGATIVHLMTVAPTFSFWDCGEFITSAVTLGVPHPPGNPLFQLLGRMFSFLPLGDMGYRMNLISTFSSSLSVLLTFLIAMRLLRVWKGEPKTSGSALTMIISAAVGAFILCFSDTFWFNAAESEVYAIGIFFIALPVWIATEWYFHVGVFDSERSLLLIAYIMGLSCGIHLLSLFAFFYVFILFYFRDRRPEDINLKSASIAAVLIIIAFSMVYPVIMKYIPSLLAKDGGIYILLVIIAGATAVVAMKKFPAQLRMAIFSLMLVTIGYSTYLLVVIRANQQPALNENAPKTFAELYSYLNREQYGQYPLFKGQNFDDRTQSIDFEASKLFPRRWNPESVQAYKKYSSDFEYFLKFQVGHSFLRYFGWNFVGRAGDMMDAPVAFIGDNGNWSDSEGFPSKYYAIPLILGLLGLFYHFKKDWRSATAMGFLFFICGFGLVLYFNMNEPQVRERDYFYIGAFFVFALWAGLGVYGLFDMLRQKVKMSDSMGFVLAGALFVVGPLNMLKENYHVHDRHLNYVAFDYAYNLLQSCEKDAILITGGDNDTFPVWFLQYSAGVRRDVRVVNLSLVNTPWYSKQLKNEMPYGAKKVLFSYSDADLERMTPVQWESRRVHVPVNTKEFNLGTLADVPFVKMQPKIPDTLSFTINPTFTDPQGTKGIRNQDLLIVDILMNNLSKRPIYFGLSTSPTDRIGLEEHLIVEGLAWRVTPFTFPSRQDRYYSAINVPVTMRHLAQQRTQPDSNRAFGFMFRELDNPKINLDEPSARMVYSFRVLFMALAQVLYQEGENFDKAKDVVRQMNKLFPGSVHKFDPSLKTDLANMFMYMGDTTEYVKFAKELEPYYLGELEKDPAGKSSMRSPYRVLLDYYEISKQAQKGVSLLKRYQSLYPSDPYVNQQLQEWEQKAKSGK